MWNEPNKKPIVFVNILLFTEKECMVEGFWTGKTWINSYNHEEVQCKLWRNLPKLIKANIKRVNKSVCKVPSTYKNKEFRSLQRVKYVNGKMKCL